MYPLSAPLPLLLLPAFALDELLQRLDCWESTVGREIVGIPEDDLADSFYLARFQTW